MSTFDPATFMDAVISTSFEKPDPIPEGSYIGVIGDVIPKTWSSEKGSGHYLEIHIRADIPPEIQDEFKLGYSTVTLTDSVFLDLTESGNLDSGKGKNKGLRSYREAVDLNKNGESFSINALVGKPLLVFVKHKLFKDSVTAKVARVAKIA